MQGCNLQIIVLCGLLTSNCTSVVFCWVSSNTDNIVSIYIGIKQLYENLKTLTSLYEKFAKV